eukprot:GGOE01020839.1.p1 GENE.GGOE01020839.1~~GGOE01020839.1.p1  ORF type:complete len:460 (-),score=148.71 GGOE01020839.1:338-1717(-)
MAYLLWLALCIVCVKSEVFRLRVQHSERKVIDLGAFGFAGGTNSNFTLILKQFEYHSPEGKLATAAPAPVGFALEERDTINTARLEQNYRYLPGTCFADWKRPDRIAMVMPSTNWTIMDKKKEILLSPSISKAHPQTIDLSGELQTGFLALFFFNCNEKSKVSFQVEVHEYNVFGDVPDYLSLGKSNLPVMYLAFFVTYVACLTLWLHSLITNRAQVHKIHYLMACLVALKATSLFFEAVQYKVIKVHGHHYLSADVPYYFFLTVKGICLFVVILLIGTGWSFLKPFLGEKDKRILMVVLPLQVIINVAMIVVDTLNEGNSSWSMWRDLLRILDIVCCCAILLPIVWSIRNLREANLADGKVSRNLMRLRQFRTFYILVVAYVYFTRIVVVLIRSALHYKVTWVAPFIFELATLLFYAISGYKFRPGGENTYLTVNQDDLDDLDVTNQDTVDEAVKAGL